MTCVQKQDTLNKPMKILDVPQSGSIAGTTSSRNRYGQYRRSRATPVQPRTPAQLAARARLAAIASSWRTLDAPTQAAWASFAAQIKLTDSLGQTYTPTALQAYVSVCSVADVNKELPSFVGQQPPPIQTFIQPPVDNLEATDEPSIVFQTSTVPQQGLAIYAAPPTSPGVSFVHDFRWIYWRTPGAGGAVNITAAWTAKFGAPVVGSRVWVRARLVSQGQLSPPVTLSAVVEPAA